jgi:fermentation-respiration switch protein FrsA (DUF1100 family)
VISLLMTVAIGVVALLTYFWWVQERVAFQPQGPPYPAVSDARRVDYRAADGQPLFGYVVGDVPAARGVLILFHGNADLAAWQIPWGGMLAERTGYAVFLPEYRGYMGLPGRPTHAGLKADALAAYDYVRSSLEVEPERIVLAGHSVGSAIAAELAGERPVRALLLQSPFTSTHEMARRMITPALALVWRFLSRIPYDTRAAVAAVNAPVSVIHGARDAIIPPQMGRAVFEAAPVKGELTIVESAGHNDLALVGEEYWEWWERALQ